MVKISHAGCLGLSPAISLGFSVKMCAASKIVKNSQNPLFGGFKVIDVNKSKKLVTIASYNKSHVYTYL